MPETSKPVYAALLQDRTYQVEIGLYPMPGTVEELATVLSHVQAMPHTEEERDAITRRLAVGTAGVLPQEAWTTHFGALATEGEDLSEAPLQIELTQENYGLLYSAVQFAPGSRGPAVPMGEAVQPAGDPAEAVTQAEPAAAPDPDPILAKLAEMQTAFQAQLDALKAQVEESAKPEADKPADAAENTVTPDPAAATAEKTETDTPVATPAKTDEADKEEELVQTELQKAEASAKKGVAASCALLLRTLRKPQARGKSQSELAEALSGRTLESLNDLLTDLQVEMDAGALPTAAQLPSLKDPTASTEGAEDTSEGLEDENTPEVVEGQPIAQLGTVEELATDEEEDILTLFWPGLEATDE